MKNHSYKNFLLEVEKPARYIGQEYGQIVKPDAKIKFLFVFPDTYEIGMSHMGLKILYNIINSIPEVCCERFFAPWTDMEKILKDRDIIPVSLETGTPINQFDIIGFSSAYELNYTNILNILSLGKIPLHSKDRTGNDPLIIAGGPLCLYPEPISNFIDAFFIGEAEQVIIEFFDKVLQSGGINGSKREIFLKDLSKIEGIYIPSLYSTCFDRNSNREIVISSENAPYPVKKRFIKNLDTYPFPACSPVAKIESIFDRAGIEIARGCGGNCRFCQAGYIYRPVRERDPLTIIKTVEAMLKFGGYDEAALSSLSTADYSMIEEVIKTTVEHLTKDNICLSVSSLKAYGLGSSLSRLLTNARTTSLTLAPEAGSQKLRDIINKHITEDEIINGAVNSLSDRRRKLKLYFMIGLPQETEDDLKSIVDISLKIASEAKKKYGYTPELTISVSNFIPKPFTPLQWVKQISFDEIIEKQSFLSDLTHKHRFLKIKTHNPHMSILEGIFARGDRAVSAFLEEAWKLGARFDSWNDQFNKEVWNNAVENSGLNINNYLNSIPIDSSLPWDHIDIGIKKEHLIKEFNKAIELKTTPVCNTNSISFSCSGCGFNCKSEDIEKKKDFFKNNVSNFLLTKNKESQDKPCKIRFIFSKFPPATYLGHLDFQLSVIRTLKRAGLNLMYSKGFHPQPKFRLVAPLSLGMIGLNEIGECEVISSDNPEVILNNLQKACYDGFIIKKLKILDLNEPKINSTAHGNEYLLISEQQSLLDELEEILTKKIKENNNESLIKFNQVIDYIKKISDSNNYYKNSVNNTGLLIGIKLNQAGGNLKKMIQSLGFNSNFIQIIRTGFYDHQKCMLV